MLCDWAGWLEGDSWEALCRKKLSKGLCHLRFARAWYSRHDDDISFGWISALELFNEELGVIRDERVLLVGLSVDPMEGGERNEILAPHLIELSDGVILQELSELGLSELEIHEIARESLIILCVDFKVLQSLTFLQVEARLKAPFDFERDSLTLFHLLEKLVLLRNERLRHFQEDDTICEHIGWDQFVVAALFQADF